MCETSLEVLVQPIMHHSTWQRRAKPLGEARKKVDTHSLHCSSFWGLPFRILNIDLAKPKKGTTMETIGTVE